VIYDMNKRTLEGGLVGYLLGRRNLHPLGGLVVLLALALGLIALAVGLVATYPLLAVVALAVVALAYRHRARYLHVPQPPSHRALPPSQDDLDRAFAEGFNRGQREARKVEASWRSVPAYDPTDPGSF
jgi:hypothetical protein